jgi:hypothetical protein
MGLIIKFESLPKVMAWLINTKLTPLKREMLLKSILREKELSDEYALRSKNLSVVNGVLMSKEDAVNYDHR